MLEIKGLDKYFFKGKKNQIHVIDNTTLSMEDKGLVALLGPSGCGKTTLLNVIGGLDKADKGDVFVGGQRITRRRSGKTDAIRSLNIGYIFQNYNLVENMTVFDNVAIALRMVGVKNEKEIEEKVNYVLHKTGMFRYRNRLAEMLSGGERQRVGIARAIVKNPAVIIADEPTGNLDSRNTIDVMNIIKTISRDKLVILVTHEEELAKFYATRIIRISDGAIVSDEEGGTGEGLDYRMDYKVYLGDIEDHNRLKSDKYNIDFYNESDGSIDLDIVIQNGSILIRNNTPGSRLEVVDDDSPIELIDDSYRLMEEGAEEDVNFSISKLETKGKRRYKSIMGPVRMLKAGYAHVSDYSTIKKILLMGFVISAMFVTYSVCSIFGTLNVTDDMFVAKDRSYIDVLTKHMSISQYESIEDLQSVDYVLPGDSTVSLEIKYDTYLQTSQAEIYIGGSLSDYSKLSSESLIYGNLPENDREIVVDKLAIKNTIRNMGTKQVGLAKVRDYLGQTVSVGAMGEFKISGISDLDSPCIYADREKFIGIISCSDNEFDYSGGLVDYELVKDDFEKTGGQWPKAYQVMVSDDMKEDVKIGKTIDAKVGDKKLTVSGYYRSAKGREELLVNEDTIKDQLIVSMPGVTVCPFDKHETMADLRDMELNVKDSYSQAKKDYINQNKAYTRSSLIAAMIILAISCIEIYIIMRASFLSRIREVGVYRAIGVKKGDIYRIFTGEILTITTFTALPGFLFMFYVIYRLSKISYFDTAFLTTPAVAAVCLGIIYIANLLFGLIPVHRTIRKKPAVILARTDIN